MKKGMGLIIAGWLVIVAQIGLAETAIASNSVDGVIPAGTERYSVTLSCNELRPLNKSTGSSRTFRLLRRIKCEGETYLMIERLDVRKVYVVLVEDVILFD